MSWTDLKKGGERRLGKVTAEGAELQQKSQQLWLKVTFTCSRGSLHAYHQRRKFNCVAFNTHINLLGKISESLYPMTNHFYNITWSSRIPSNRAQRLPEWYNQYENDANHMVWSSQSPGPNPVEQLRENVDKGIGLCLHHHHREKRHFVKEMLFISLQSFRYLSQAKVHWSCLGGLWWHTTLSHFLN